MALKKQKSNIPNPEKGNIPARLVRIVEIGDHKAGPGGKFGTKSLVQLFFTLPTRIIDQPDNELYHGKQHMVRTAYLNLSASDKSSLVKDYIKVMQPGFDTKGDVMPLAPLLDSTIYLTIDNNETDTGTFTNIMNTMGVPEGMTVGPTDITKFYFDFDSPSEDVWIRYLTDKQKEKIQEALNYSGSAVEAMVLRLEAMGDTPREEEPAVEQPVATGEAIDLTDDIPF